jgi:hypothetical protein
VRDLVVPSHARRAVGFNVLLLILVEEFLYANVDEPFVLAATNTRACPAAGVLVEVVWRVGVGALIQEEVFLITLARRGELAGFAC